MTNKMLAIALVAAAGIQSVAGHTWLEMIRSISAKGALTGATGYPLGFVPRNATGFSDDDMVWKLLDQTNTTNMCMPSQQPGNQTAGYPRLTVSAGDFIAMQYLENGHVTAPQLPAGKPYRSGNVYVYATTNAKKDAKFLDIHGAWTPDGTGGDKTGSMIASTFFDDGKCYEDRSTDPTEVYTERFAASGGADAVYCQTDAQIPSDVKAGDTLTLYWVWDWPLFANEVGMSNETYTTCLELTVGDASASQREDLATSAKTFNFDTQLNRTRAAVASQISSQFEVFQLGTGTSSPPAPTLYPTTALYLAVGGAGASTMSSSSDSASAAQTTAAANELVKTVTVTAAPEIVTEFRTVTVEDDIAARPTSVSASASAPAAVSSSSVVAPTPVVVDAVTGFLRARQTGHTRRAGRL